MDIGMYSNLKDYLGQSHIKRNIKGVLMIVREMSETM